MDGARLKRVTAVAEEVNKFGGPFTYNGLMWPPTPGLYPEPEIKFQEICDLECRDSDVFLCTFPKTGTNWAHEIISMIIIQSTRYNSVNLDVSFLDIVQNKDCIKNIDSPRLLLTHLPYRYLPRQLRNGTGKIVYLTRNTKDVYVSFFNFQKGKSMMGRSMESWEEFFESTVLGEEVLYGGWYEYTKEWERESDSKNILPMYFEDMKKDLAGNVMKIAEFLNIPCSTEFVQEVAEKCRFDNLKKNRIDPTALFNVGVESSLYRKGQVGDGKNWFSVAQNERFEAFYKEKMKDSKLQFIYEL